TVAAFGLLTVHTLWARRALFHEVRRQQARERRIAAAREHDKEAADASAS
ncbi:heme exporter protein CcmD, partial [Klebsiella pneumoniae]